MGLRNAIVKAAGKAADGVSKVSALSSYQLEQVWEARDNYMSQVPDPADPAAEEVTLRLLASCGVEVHGAHLPQIDDIYLPVEPKAEYEGKAFDADYNVRFLKIDKWVVDPEEDSLEKLVNVYDVLSNEDCNIALVFRRTWETSEVYLAVVNAGNASDKVDANRFLTRLEGAVKGNFPGSETVPEPNSPLSEIGDGGYSVSIVSNIPAEKSEKFASQTIEKLLDGIVPEDEKGEYTLILLASPVHDVEERKLRLCELHSALSPYAQWQTNYTFNELVAIGSSATVGVNAGVSAGVQNGTNSSIADSVSESDQESVAKTKSSTEGETYSQSHAEGDVEGSTETHQTGTSKTESENSGTSAGASYIANISTSHSHGESWGVQESVAQAKSTSHTVTETVGKAISSSTGKAVTRSLGRAVSKGVTKTAGVFRSTNLGGNFGASFARSSSVTANIGKNEGIIQTHANYAIQHALEMLERQMKRLDLASALGMWDFAAYVVSEDPEVASNVAHSYLALTQGEESYMAQAAVNEWRGDAAGAAEKTAQTICSYLCDLRHPIFGLHPGLLALDPKLNVYPPLVRATTALSGKELSYSLNFPKKSVPGLPVIECAGFGRSVSSLASPQSGAGTIELGRIFHMQREEAAPVNLSADSLPSHVFVTGSTGAGKTNTVCRILDQASEGGVGFLVVEPAKGEYKDVYGSWGDVAVYGTNPRVASLLKVNPFSFPEDVHVLEHLDRLVEVFNVCWPMYAAMPAVLKDAIERSYSDCGWDLVNSTNEFGRNYCPTFKDVARNVRNILDTSEYDAENKGAYKGSLLTRLRSLSNGINGTILGIDEIPAEELFDRRVIVDLSRVGSTETKSLIMGLLVLKLQEYRMSQGLRRDGGLKHITVLEEAHNLLKRTSTDQPVEGGNLIGKSVEMLSNAIAEMRAFGECFIIADQAPGLLDMAAIRNTNTK